jgi:hypothetical protein
MKKKKTFNFREKLILLQVGLISVWVAWGLPFVSLFFCRGNFEKYPFNCEYQCRLSSQSFFLSSFWEKTWRHQRRGDKKCLTLTTLWRRYYCVSRHKRLPFFFLTRFPLPPSRWVIDHRQWFESTPLITWTPFSSRFYFLFQFLFTQTNAIAIWRSK